MRMPRRDFLLLRAGQPAVLSCEQLFMRYLDAQMSGTTTELFAALADDLRAAKSVRIADTSWLSREDLKREVDRVLASFTAAGGRIVAALVVAIVMLATTQTIAAAPQAKVAAKSGAAMCVLTAADFAAAGITTNPKPNANVNDAGASVYCAYTKNSGSFGGVELDVFNPAGGSVADAKDTLKTATSEGHPAPTPIALAGADEALWSPNMASGSVPFATIAVRRGMLVFVLSIPEHKDSKAQLTKLAGLALQRL
jgi:hypothetical protein